MSNTRVFVDGVEIPYEREDNHIFINLDMPPMPWWARMFPFLRRLVKPAYEIYMVYGEE